jgi:hypothetical protein
VTPGAAGTGQIDQAEAMLGRAAVQQDAPRLEKPAEQRLGIAGAGRAILK